MSPTIEQILELEFPTFEEGYKIYGRDRLEIINYGSLPIKPDDNHLPSLACKVELVLRQHPAGFWCFVQNSIRPL